MIRTNALFIALLLLPSAGCGGDPESAAKFVGTWMYSAGTVTASCGGPSRTEALKGTVTIASGDDADLVILEGTQCLIKFDVMGQVATARSGQSCEAVTNGTSARRTIAALTMSMTGSTMTMNESSMLTVVAGGRSAACNLTRSGVLTRVSK